jgi:inorganic pyrophosphatase/exopolyphosphatase
MNSSQATSPDTTLSPVLAEIADIDRQMVEANDRIDTLKSRRQHLEKLAVEEILTQRLDGVRAAGRSWRIEWEHSMSVPEARKEAVMEAARKAGCDAELTTVNTARLKSFLKEMAKEAGRDARSSFSDGTPFEGLVGEYVHPKLRHLTVG